VSFRGYVSPVAKVNSTKNAVHPFVGGGTRPTHVFGPDAVSAVD
jgi:fido (protein-threonine AMPylation protein)